MYIFVIFNSMRWNLSPKQNLETVTHLAQALGIDPLLSSLLVQRGITTFDQAKRFFRPSLEELHDPFLMKDMDKAVARLELALKKNEKILVFGDYDVDGTTSCAVFYHFFKLINYEVKLVQPSRFIEEIDGQYLEYLTPEENNYRYKPMIDSDIFGDVDKSKLRLAKPIGGTPPKQYGDEQPATVRNLKPVNSNAPSGAANLFDNKLTIGNVVMHERFGKGEVINLEGVGADKKAEIKFEVGGIKKLLLRFAKLDVIG
mgnify:CR=1 FL=1